MTASFGISRMRRGLKPAMLALGAAAAIPTVIIIADQKLENSDSIDYTRLKKAKHDLWVEDGKGFLQSMAARLYSLGKLGSKEDTPATTLDHRLPFPSAHPSHEESLEDILDLRHLGEDPPTATLAKEFSSQITEIRRNAENIFGGPLPSVRFTDSELMRYAIHHGYLRAHNEHGRIRALYHATLAAAETAQWLGNYPFATDNQLQQFNHLIWWTQASPEGRPTLHVNIGQAVHECRGPQAIAFANAVVSHVERAVRFRMKDAPEGHDRVDVVVYAAGTSAMSASRAARVLSSVVTTLSHHYPGRLHELALLDLPRVLLWLVKGAKKLVHPQTARKVISMSSEGFHLEEIVEYKENVVINQGGRGMEDEKSKRVDGIFRETRRH